MSTDTIKNYDDQDALKLACPACIEAATVVKEGQEFVPEYALHKYTFEQLEDHLNSNKHSREQTHRSCNEKEEHFFIVMHLRRYRGIE